MAPTSSTVECRGNCDCVSDFIVFEIDDASDECAVECGSQVVFLQARWEWKSMFAAGWCMNAIDDFNRGIEFFTGRKEFR